MLKTLLVLMTFCFSQQIMADSFNLIINGIAMHEEKKNYNEENWGLGFEYNFKEKDKWINFINGGFFKDSLSNNSNYLGGGSKRRFLLADDKDGWHIDAGITAFIMTRKNYKNGQPFLGALPYASVGTSQFAINVTYIPSVSPKLVALWFFQASFKVAEW
ncbi:MAG: hypothetical protein OQK75_07375 [Gammaproteobacteria bacterium]|nr:hypothetical protein [Gammaproteobacteria bacterium]